MKAANKSLPCRLLVMWHLGWVCYVMHASASSFASHLQSISSFLVVSDLISNLLLSLMPAQIHIKALDCLQPSCSFRICRWNGGEECSPWLMLSTYAWERAGKSQKRAMPSKYKPLQMEITSLHHSGADWTLIYILLASTSSLFCELLC